MALKEIIFDLISISQFWQRVKDGLRRIGNFPVNKVANCKPGANSLKFKFPGHILKIFLSFLMCFDHKNIRQEFRDTSS
jgi:hypothetical protein